MKSPDQKPSRHEPEETYSPFEDLLPKPNHIPESAVQSKQKNEEVGNPVDRLASQIYEQYRKALANPHSEEANLLQTLIAKSNEISKIREQIDQYNRETLMSRLLTFFPLVIPAGAAAATCYVAFVHRFAETRLPTDFLLSPAVIESMFDSTELMTLVENKFGDGNIDHFTLVMMLVLITVALLLTCGLFIIETYEDRSREKEDNAEHKDQLKKINDEIHDLLYLLGIHVDSAISSHQALRAVELATTRIQVYEQVKKNRDEIIQRRRSYLQNHNDVEAGTPWDRTDDFPQTLEEEVSQKLKKHRR